MIHAHSRVLLVERDLHCLKPRHNQEDTERFHCEICRVSSSFEIQMTERVMRNLVVGEWYAFESVLSLLEQHLQSA